MKSKKLTYGLLVFVVILWGAILYKVYQTYFPSEELEIQMVEEPMDIQSLGMNRQEYELRRNYTDPFLKNIPFQYTNLNNKPVNKPKVIQQSTKRVYKPSINWPKIEYLGRIASKQSDDKKGIITINEEELLVMEGDELQEIQIVDLERDSIQLIYKEEKKTIRLKKS